MEVVEHLFAARCYLVVTMEEMELIDQIDLDLVQLE